MKIPAGKTLCFLVLVAMVLFNTSALGPGFFGSADGESLNVTASSQLAQDFRSDFQSTFFADSVISVITQAALGSSQLVVVSLSNFYNLRVVLQDSSQIQVVVVAKPSGQQPVVIVKRGLLSKAGSFIPLRTAKLPIVTGVFLSLLLVRRLQISRASRTRRSKKEEHSSLIPLNTPRVAVLLC